MKDKILPYDFYNLYQALALMATLTRTFSRKGKVLSSAPTTVKQLRQRSRDSNNLGSNAIRRASHTNIRRANSELRIKQDQPIANESNTHPGKSRLGKHNVLLQLWRYKRSTNGYKCQNKQLAVSTSYLGHHLLGYIDPGGETCSLQSSTR